MGAQRVRQTQAARETVVQRLRGGPPEEPPPPPSQRSLWLGLLRLSADARQRFYRTFSLLGVLGGVAAIAVVAGRLANNSTFWAAAGSVFFLACAALVAYAAKGLGVAAETADLLRAHHASGEPSSQEGEHAAAQSGFEFRTRRPLELTEEGEVWLAANVMRRASTEAPAADEVDWIIENIRRSDPPREQSAKEWVRRNIDPAEPDEPLRAKELAWLIEHIQVMSQDEGEEDEEESS
jgi:hypothetical protein